jgi:hypothetical protein
MNILKKVIKDLEPGLAGEMSLRNFRRRITYIRFDKNDTTNIIKEMQRKNMVDIKKDSNGWRVLVRKKS